MKSRILYIERKAGQLTGKARIGRVTYSKSGLTILYKGKAFRSLKGRGFKANYYEVESGEEYWISGPRRDGADRLYGERLPTAIDPDIWDEYWTTIRGQMPPAFVSVPAETEYAYKNGVFKEGHKHDS